MEECCTGPVQALALVCLLSILVPNQAENYLQECNSLLLPMPAYYDISFHLNLNVSSLFDSATASLILRGIFWCNVTFGLFESHTCRECLVDQVNGLIQDVSLQEKEQLGLRQFFRMLIFRGPRNRSSQNWTVKMLRNMSPNNKTPVTEVQRFHLSNTPS